MPVRERATPWWSTALRSAPAPTAPAPAVVQPAGNQAEVDLANEVVPALGGWFTPFLTEPRACATDVDAAATPREKLLAWQRLHVQEARDEALFGDPDQEAERARAADHTEQEVEREVSHLLADPSIADADLAAKVDALIARKALERQIERTYRVDLTNTDEVRADGTRVVWTLDELRAAERALREAPPGHTAGNALLRELHRTETNDAGDNADHLDGRIRMYDAGASLARGTTRARDHAAPETLAEDGPEATKLEWVLLHELGHDVHDGEGAYAYGAYREAMGVERLTSEDAWMRMSTDQHVDLISNPGTEVRVDGRVYVSEGGTVRSWPDALYPGGDPSSAEYFAEHYNQAILAPESVAVEYLDVPAAQAEQAARTVAERRAALAKIPPFLLSERSAAASQLAAAEADLRAARAEQETWARAYGVMRDGVFHTDEAAAETADRLFAEGMSSALLDEFDRRAARLSTPLQLARLEAELRARHP